MQILHFSLLDFVVFLYIVLVFLGYVVKLFAISCILLRLAFSIVSTSLEQPGFGLIYLQYWCSTLLKTQPNASCIIRISTLTDLFPRRFVWIQAIPSPCEHHGVYCFLVVFPQPQSFLSGLPRSVLSHRSEGTPLQISGAFHVALSSVAVFSTNCSLLGLLKLIYFLNSQRPLGSLWVPQPCQVWKFLFHIFWPVF